MTRSACSGTVATRRSPWSASWRSMGLAPEARLPPRRASSLSRTDDWSNWRDQIGLGPWVDRWALDIVIGEPELWNRGLGTRAVVALLRYLFVEKRAAEVVLSPVAD